MTDAELEVIRKADSVWTEDGAYDLESLLKVTADRRGLLRYVDELRAQVCDLWDADGGAGGRAYLFGVAAGVGKAVAWLEQQADDLREKTITSDAFVLESYSAYLAQEYLTAPLAYPDQLRADNERLRAENERLRAELEAIVDRRDDWGEYGQGQFPGPILDAIDDARQLLGEQT
jgi:hypothetical protein